MVVCVCGSSGWYWSTRVGSATRHGHALKYTLSCIRVREWGGSGSIWRAGRSVQDGGWLAMGRRDGGTEGAEESRGGATPTDLGAALEVEEVSAPLEARPATVRQALVHALEAHSS